MALFATKMWADPTIPSTTLTLPATGLGSWTGFDCGEGGATSYQNDVDGYVIYSPYAIRMSLSTQTWYATTGTTGSGTATWSTSDIFRGDAYYKIYKTGETSSRADVFKQNKKDLYHYYRVTNCTGVKIYYKSSASFSISLKVYEVTGEPGSETATIVAAATNSASHSKAEGATLANNSTLDISKNYIIEVHGEESNKANAPFYEIAFYYPGTPSAPEITSPASDPDLQTITYGETKTFTVTASGYPAPTYQWYKNTSKSTTGAEEIGGATAASYTTSATLAASANNYYFYCVATNASGDAQSPYFSLKVNELGGDLTAHTPGVYKTAQASGGYGADLIEVSERQYETYYFYSNNSKIYLSAGNKAYNADGHYNLIDGSAFTADTEYKSGWIAVSPNSMSTSVKYNSDQFNINANTAFLKMRTQKTNTVRLKVSGYDQFAFGGKDNSTSDAAKQFVVKIDGVTQEYTHNTTSKTIFSFPISTSEHYIEITVGGTTTSDSQFDVFSLRIPELPEATKYTVGVTGNNPCIAGGESATITLSGSQTGVSYQLYKDDAAVDGKVIAGTGSAISFMEIVEAGTYTVKSIKNETYKKTEMTGSADVTLGESPVITTQPTASQSVAVKTALSLSVESSTDGVSYQWYSNTSATTEGATKLTGKNEATLNIKAASTETTTYYYCIISKDGMCDSASDYAEVVTKLGCKDETMATSTITGAKTDNHSGCTTVVNLNNTDGKLGDGSYFEMSLTGGFKAGDVVTVREKANDYESGKLYMVYGTHDSYSGYQVQNGPTNGNTANVEFVIPSNMATIAFLRTTSTDAGDKTQNHELKSVTVTREVCYLDDAPISWVLNTVEVTELTIYLDQAYTLPTLSNEEDLAITFESTNESTATITDAGVCTVVGTGSTTISAAFAGNEDYKATEVSYALTVVAKYPTGINDVENEVKAIKRIENGMLIIEKNGVRYNVTGQVIK